MTKELRPLEWLRAHRSHRGSECLTWPFSRSRGHAQVWFEGKLRKAARLMCQWVYGNPPTPKHETAHSCGNGHLGCVNPSHLSWKTRSENQRDRRKHGTHGRGFTTGGAKLTPDQAREIREIGSKKSKEELGRRFRVTPSTIAKILNGERWKTYDGYKREKFNFRAATQK